MSFALACAFIEFIYSYIAVQMSEALFDLGMYTYLIQIVSIIVFMIAGIYYFNKKPSGTAAQKVIAPIYQGIILSLVNVVAIPFWLVYTSVLTSYHWIKINSDTEIIYYITGISIGTLFALLAFALLSEKINKRFSLQSSLVNKVVGLLLIGSSLLAFVDLMK